jgi:hypothetical protein
MRQFLSSHRRVQHRAEDSRVAGVRRGAVTLEEVSRLVVGGRREEEILVEEIHGH